MLPHSLSSDRRNQVLRNWQALISKTFTSIVLPSLVSLRLVDLRAPLHRMRPRSKKLAAAHLQDLHIDSSARPEGSEVWIVGNVQLSCGHKALHPWAQLHVHPFRPNLSDLHIPAHDSRSAQHNRLLFLHEHLHFCFFAIKVPTQQDNSSTYCARCISGPRCSACRVISGCCRAR
jgi:hypothetical protein